MRATDRMLIATFIAMTLAALAMLVLTSDLTALLYAVPLSAVLLGISLVARRLRVAAWLIHLWQVLVLAGVALGLGLSAQPGGGNWLSQLSALYLDGVLTIRTESAPMPANVGVRWLIIVVMGLLTILADLLVVTLATPAWGLAPLLSLYLIPALALPDGVKWWAFLLIGTGYLIILAADVSSRLGQWTRNLSADTAERNHSAWGVWRMAAVVGIPALAVSLAAGSVLPTLSTWELQARRPRGSGPIQLVDPTIELNKNLNQQSSRVVIRYTSTNPNGEYLRLTSLSQLDKSGWKLTPMSLNTGSLPNPPGLASSVTSTTKIQVTDFSTQYLPAPYAPQSFNAAGEWAYDRNTMTVVSTLTNGSESTRNLSYDITSVRADPNPAGFTEAKIGVPPDAAITAQVPADVPTEIKRLTAQITQGQPTPVLKASAIQEYLRDPRNFKYSTTAPAGDGYDVMTNFLLKDKSGYCVHFASAMALMARIEGIPSRVAVGFLPGENKGGTWQVRGRNMHAWPELYFADYGWVRFEPTAAVADAPMWTVVSPANTPTPSASATPSSSASTSAAPTASTSSTKPSEEPSQAPEATVAEPPFPWGRALAIAGGVLAAVALISLPWLVRTLQRRRRLTLAGDAHSQAAALWAEVRDTTLDSGLRWPAGSPRSKAAALGASLTPVASEALGRLGLVVERSRYARSLSDVSPQSVDDARTFVDQAREQRTGLRGWIQGFWPRSLWHNLIGGSGG